MHYTGPVFLELTGSLFSLEMVATIIILQENNAYFVKFTGCINFAGEMKSSVFLFIKFAFHPIPQPLCSSIYCYSNFERITRYTVLLH